MFEPPVGASSWSLAIVRRMLAIPGAAKVNFDFCKLGMCSADKWGPGLVKKRTSIVTNSADLALGLGKQQCTQDHRHVILMEGRAGPCQQYPEQFCDYVCRTVMKEKNKIIGNAALMRLGLSHQEARDITMTINELNKADPHEEELYADYDFFDDLSGQQLDHQVAVEARREEMAFVRRMGGYHKVLRS